MLWFACSSNKVELSNRNFKDEVAQQQNLIFTFSQDLIADSLVDTWDSTAYIEFEPQVRGKFKWTAPNELMFSPDIGFKPSTDYQARVTKEVLSKIETVEKEKRKKLAFGDIEPIAFHTPYLNLGNTDMYWAKNSSGGTELRFNLNFNYKVNPMEVANRLGMQIDGKSVSAKVTSGNLSETVMVTVAQPSGVSFDEKTAAITVREGLKCAESAYVTPKSIETKAEVPDKDDFRIVQVLSEYENEKGLIRVFTNQSVENNGIERFIKLEPEVDFKVEQEEYGFVIKGDFKMGSYDLTISKNLRGIFGGALPEEFTQVVVFGEMKPTIAFTHTKAIYLSSKGSKNIGVRIINVPKVNVKVFKIYENNILAFMRNSGAYGGYEYGGEEGYEGDYEGDYQPSYYMSDESENPYGDVVLDREIETKNLQKVNGVHLLNLDLEQINDFRGIYIVKVTSEDEQYLNATQLVSISDIGFMVKETENEVLVFANSILSAQPMAGVDVNLISTNNQNIYTAQTDADGVAKFPELKKKAPNFQVTMITGRQGADFNYLLFNQTRIETSRYEVGGMRDNPSGYQAFLYGDRDIYRPGETVYLNTVVRNAQWKTVDELPLKLKVLLPSGKEFALLKGNLNEQGAFATSVKLPASTVTGTYNVEVYTANDVLLTNKSVSVEEFIPDRIKVNVLLNKPWFKDSEMVQVDATALNLFGPPAANRNYEMTFQIKRKAFYAANYSDYNFYTAEGKEINFQQDVRQGTTNAEGLAHEELAIANEYKDMGVLNGSVYTTVFDETGRPVNRLNSFDIYTQDVFYGIKLTDSYVGTKQAVQIPLIALNKDGKPLQSVKARVQVVKLNWQTVLEKNSYGELRYVSQKKEQILTDRILTINGTSTAFSFVPSLSGEYEIRVSRPGADTYVGSYLYAYGYGFTQNTSFEVDKEGQITIETDKKTYAVGDKAEVLLKTPFVGKVLVSVERNKVYDYFYVDTDKKSAKVTIPIKEEYLPNVYITATLIKPLDDGIMPLTVAHGFHPISVEEEDTKLPVSITAAAQSGSNTKQTITVKTEPGAEVTIAVVDEGILQLKNFKSPDPFAYFFQKRALEVTSYDLYPKLFPELSGAKSSTGGDGYNLEKRVNPLTNKRVKLVAFWSGPLEADGSGEVEYTVDIPQFSGDLRIMAVAYKADAFGGKSTNMKVADPVVISSSLPRFLSPGDQLQMPVTLSNTTKQSTTATARVKVSGVLEIEGDDDQSVDIPANSESRVEFLINAKTAVGTGQVVVEVNANGKTYTETTDITVRPIQSLLKRSGSGSAAAGSAKNISLATDFIPATTQAQLVVSTSPVVQFADDLDYLLQYPYGCVEQTTSGVFPQLYFADLSQAMSKSRPTANKAATANANYNVQEGILRLQSMQMHNGALSYWPEGGYESWWGTAYAAHFLTEAKKAGFQVNDQVLNRIYTYLGQKVKMKELEEYFYYDGAGSRRTKKIAPKEAAYSLYVLALGGRQDVPTMNYFKANKSELALDSRYLLAATYQLLGDNASFRAIIPSAFSGERSVQAFGGSFYSYIRDEAISLNALIESEPKNAQIPIMARHLSEQMRGQKYLNTQERAFGLLALGKLARTTNKNDVTAEVKAGSTVLGTFEGETLVLAKGLANKNLTIRPEGTGSLYYFWQAEGLTESNEVKEEDSFLQVRKTFYDRFGAPISGSAFKQNDMVVVKLSLATTDGSTVNNVVITDMLPAGFEIENPRISDLPQMSWADNAASPEYFDMRDDRINLFTTATSTVRHYYYVVRAVSTGTFKMGPVSADAMYNGEYHSINGAGEIRVISRNGEGL
jgi:hypothetical protein